MSYYCKACDEEISFRQYDEQYGLCDECYKDMCDLMDDLMCNDCEDKDYCKEHDTCCNEYDKEFERRVKNA